jgi:hypothetical protein
VTDALRKLFLMPYTVYVIKLVSKKNGTAFVFMIDGEPFFAVVFIMTTRNQD